MLIVGILSIYLVGLLIVGNLSLRFTPSEAIGLAFPLGMGAQTLMMTLADLLGLPLTALTMFALTALLAVALLVPFCLRRRRLMADRRARPFTAPSGYNLVWLLFIALTVYLEYMNLVKCLYFPAFDRDSLAGFDTIGYVIAQEHTFRGLSIFRPDYMPSIHDAGSYLVYAPMVQLSYAYVYLLGAATSKLIPALMYLSLLFAFYGSTKRVVSRTGAAIATFFMLLTPEMLAFSSMSATNVIHAVSASLGIIYVALWWRGREQRDLFVGALLLGLNIWTRTDGVVFILAALLIVFIRTLQTRRWVADLAPFLAFALFPPLLWMLFSRVSGFYTESIAILHPFWDADKAATILTHMTSHYLNLTFYGWSFLFFALSLLLNSWNLLRRRDNLPLLTMILVASLLYMVALYQIDYKWDSIRQVLAYSAKRFLFCFIPLVWFYALTNRWAQTLLSRADRFLSYTRNLPGNNRPKKQ
ncbi:MAG: glycosyltransferase family 39 protein [Prevotellaceae bacterium]|jgi:hypothetical protein|nr:glycosyltransferase family 39 protein [Prevotellaceae bacterium]